MDDAPFAERRNLLGALAAAAAALAVLVVVDVLPRIDPLPPEIEGQPLVAGGVAGVEEIEITRGRKNFRLERTDGAWKILDQGEQSEVVDERTDEFLTSLGEAVVLVDIGPASEVALEEFGLSRPREGISLVRGGEEIQIRLGDRNPPLTGVYALVLPGERVVLVGAVLLLEIDTLSALASSRSP